MDSGLFEGTRALVLLLLLLVVVAVVAGGVFLVVRALSSSSSGGPRPSVPPEGGRWAPDPSGRHQLRYWDGNAWTADVSDNGTQSLDPM